MPQLDTLTFFSQFFWLSFFFLGFYGILVKYYLPKMSRILKVRNLKISTPQSNFDNFQAENTQVSQTRDTILTTSFRDSIDLFQEKTKNTSNWLETTVANTNKVQLKNMNTKYLHIVGDFQAQDVFLFYHLRSVLAPNAFQATGFQKIFNASSISKEKFFNYRVIENMMK